MPITDIQREKYVQTGIIMCFTILYLVLHHFSSPDLCICIYVLTHDMLAKYYTSFYMNIKTYKLEKGTSIACFLSVLENGAYFFIRLFYKHCNNCICFVLLLLLWINHHLNILP